LITGIVGSHDRTGQVAATVQNLARDHGIGISTCYRYLHEAITVLAAEAPELPEVLRERLAAGDTHVSWMAPSSVPTALRRPRRTRRARRSTSGTRASTRPSTETFSSCRPPTDIRCGAPRCPGSRHDLAAAHEHGAIGALCAAAAKGLPCLADKSYCFAGIGIHAPIKNPTGNQVPDLNNRCYNSMLTRLRRLGERIAAILLTRWKTLRRITLRPSRIGAITKAALVPRY
jgi:hypothetical protein